MQDFDPGVEELPILQSGQLVVPSLLEYVPAGHRTQALEFVAPTEEEKVPIGHKLQAIEE